MNKNRLLNNSQIVTLIAIIIYIFSCSSNILEDNKVAKNSTTNISSSKDLNLDIQELLQRQAQAWETANSQAIIADFAENGVFIAPGTSLKGREDIKKAAEGYFKEFTDTKIKITRIITSEKEGAIEWTWSDTNKKTGKKSQIDDAIIFEIKDGKIIYWREYFDKQF
ncbi:SgcJ/EcaC family oxidoreductase [Rivularia sp. UHCC 0363]|uniref:nuclear transport factor 2 family protein n=1 Tax=Rivularia sp. UHCC 0363 TaxID=3110244 RepID=UPI002B216F7B|nr:SgcJ/EcaC family oxidoreductase [Rivularia sp. UHCC 0363]MEA5596229.1 SgcJ/EcaC family oxidoreductase [Rivularia sp. UHCC 0363]